MKAIQGCPNIIKIDCFKVGAVMKLLAIDGGVGIRGIYASRLCNMFSVNSRISPSPCTQMGVVVH